MGMPPAVSKIMDIIAIISMAKWNEVSLAISDKKLKLIYPINNYDF